MPREPKGQLRWWGHRYSVRVRFQDGQRQWIALPVGLTHTQAVAQAREIARKARAEPRQPTIVIVAGETVEQWAERWLAMRTQRGLESVRDDRSRLRTHIIPLIGQKPMATVRAAELEDVRDDADAKVKRAELSWKTAQHVWAVVRGMFRDARAAKDRSLRVREDNPCIGIQPPNGGPSKAKQYLYPSELSVLVACGEVPVRLRRIFALAAYLFLRASELEALRWEDVDFEHGTVNVHQSLRRYTRVPKPTKNGVSRRFAVEPALVPLLRTLAEETGGRGSILGKLGMDKYDLSRALRVSLAAAGVARPDLFTNDETRKWITFHDLRATGITWMAIRGDEPLKIKQRAGHLNLSTTEKYIRAAEALQRGFGRVFPRLPAALLAKTLGEGAGRCA